MNPRLKRATPVTKHGAVKLPPLTHLEPTMTTLTTPALFIHPSLDFVSSDTAALASHMSHCARKRSRFFGVHAALELAHSVVFTRMVTAAVVTVVLLALVGIV
jgi:hypothetical protein